MSDRLHVRPESSDRLESASTRLHQDAFATPGLGIKSQASNESATNKLVRIGHLPSCDIDVSSQPSQGNERPARSSSSHERSHAEQKPHSSHDTHVQHREHREHHDPNGHEHGKHHSHHDTHQHKHHHGNEHEQKPDVKHHQDSHTGIGHKQVDARHSASEDRTPVKPTEISKESKGDACPQTASKSPKGYDDWRKQLAPASSSSAPENRGDRLPAHTHSAAGSATERPINPTAPNLPGKGDIGAAPDITIPNYPGKTHPGSHAPDGTLPYHPGKTGTAHDGTLPYHPAKVILMEKHFLTLTWVTKNHPAYFIDKTG